MGVRVNAICPGFVETDLLSEEVIDQLAPLMRVPADEVMATLIGRVPIGRFVTPDEVAELALYLAGSASDGITGQAITLSGGF
jgi:ketoreductase